MNYNYQTTIFRSILPKMYKYPIEIFIFTIFAYELFKVKMKIVNSTRNLYILVQNASNYRRQISVVNVHANGVF